MTCTQTTMGTHGVRPGYVAACYDHHSFSNVSIGYVYDTGSWEYSLYGTLPGDYRSSKSEREIGYFAKAQAQEGCRIHKQEFRGHDCKVRKVGLATGGPV